MTPCFHPNVDQHGNICLDVLKEKWSAAYSVRTLLLSIQSLLGMSLPCGSQLTPIRSLWMVMLQVSGFIPVCVASTKVHFHCQESCLVKGFVQMTLLGRSRMQKKRHVLSTSHLSRDRSSTAVFLLSLHVAPTEAIQQWQSSQ